MAAPKDRHIQANPELLTSTRLLIGEWAARLPAPVVVDGGDIVPFLRWQFVTGQIPAWLKAGCPSPVPAGLGPLLARHAGISVAFANRILAGKRSLPTGSEWARKLFS